MSIAFFDFDGTLLVSEELQGAAAIDSSPVSMAVMASDGSLWVGLATTLYHLDDPPWGRCRAIKNCAIISSCGK